MEGNQRNEEFSGICQMSRKFLGLKFEDTTPYLHADGNDLVNIQERWKYIYRFLKRGQEIRYKIQEECEP